MVDLDPWYLETLVCPVDGGPLRQDGGFLASKRGRRYPIVEGMPVMLMREADVTIRAASSSIELATAIAEGALAGDAPLYVDSLGLSADQREQVLALHALGETYDPVVAYMVGATSGHAYSHLVGIRADYPIPAFRFPTPRPGRLLDIGCNWGRWTLAAARSGHEAVGLDPQLGAVLAARRVASQLGLKARFVVGDARHLPFRAGAFDYAWSYSVLQHFAREDAVAALSEIGRVLRPGGLARVQMANGFGVRSLYHMARRGFRPPTDFEVRYWTPPTLARAFADRIGPTSLAADCYLGLGLQWSDFARMNAIGKGALLASEALRRTSTVVPWLRWVADSLFCTSCRDDAIAEEGGRARVSRSVTPCAD